MQTNIIPHQKNKGFAISQLKGSIGQAIISAFLCEFGYEIYPFGYENHYVNITRFMKRDYSDAISTKIRSMPDLLVRDKESGELFLLQIKAINREDSSSYLINKDRFDSYKTYWPEALLILYYFLTGHIYCCKINEIEAEEITLPNGTEPCYSLKLNGFSDLPRYFKLITPDRYKEFRKEISETLRKITQLSEQYLLINT